ncbi:MAG: hypothetical protein J7639_27545, partial [Paenibacillaceae bacterium]|nr:hypothetical protein [Paenibacillaceae bacterium]
CKPARIDCSTLDGGRGNGSRFRHLTSLPCKISHVLLAISPKMANRNKIASEIAGYFREKLDFAPVWSE